jgi:hypothetical protein
MSKNLTTDDSDFKESSYRGFSRMIADRQFGGGSIGIGFDQVSSVVRIESALIRANPR